MAETKTGRDRIYAFLEDNETGVRAETLVLEVLGLKGARGVIAEKVVQAAIDNDPRFVHGHDGLWRLKPPGQGTTLSEASFVCLGLIASADSDVYALAGRKVQTHGREALFPSVEIVADGKGKEALASFADFAKDAVPAGFRLHKTQKGLNRLGRIVIGNLILEGGICLFRLGRRYYPNALLRTIEDLASVMGLTFVAARSAEGEAGLQAEVLLHLLARCESEGLNTLEAIVAELYPGPVPVRFEAYAFDADYLSDLPELPGVYMMRDRKGQVIYVGKAVNLRKRVGSYFARRSERPEKTKRILDRIWSMEVEVVGSELEALIQETKLIALCQPEFNTQVAVHDREADLGTLKDVLLILPSSEPECVELFCIVNGLSFTQLRAHRDLCDWDEVANRLRGFYFESVERATFETGDTFEILKSWVVSKRDGVNFVDLGSVGPPDEALRIVSEYIQQCENEQWEKVAWRV